MQLKKIALTDTRAFSPFFLDYVQRHASLAKFYHRFPSIENFEQQISDKKQSFTAEQRTILTEALRKQYKDVSIAQPASTNLTALSDNNTFTVTTGHQLNIFTGPLYFIYKIVTVINTCKKLKAAYPAYNFVPVYWMASEDHDYDEIKSFRLYGTKYSWETDQTGAVGRFSTKGLDQILNTLPGNVEVFRDAYTKQHKLSDAVRQYVNQLFGNEGVIVIDGDDHQLKTLLKPVIKDDLFSHHAKSLVDQTDKELASLGYKTQVFCRDINFFYLDGALRSRIEKQNDQYKVVDTDITFSRSEIEKLIDTNPEKFSPNVVLRPLYQEIILPNLAYIGGPAEVIYWLQLKQVFDYFKTPFPILMPRNFAMVMNSQVAKKFEKTKLALTDLFLEKNEILSNWTIKHTHHNLSVDDEKNVISKLFEQLKERAANLDQTLVPFVGAQAKRATTSLEEIEKRFLRAEKRLQSDKLRQIEFVKDALFPNGNLQERTDNFLNFYQEDPQFIQHLLENFDPFDYQFHVLQY